MSAPETAAPPPSSALPRRLVLGTVGLAALVAGGWWAWRQQQPAGPIPGFWELSFDTPDGGTLALASLRGRPLLLNFWATWCAPCVREMPMLDRFHREHQARGWQVLGLAIDGPTPVREFAARTPVGFPLALAGFGGTELASALGNQRGGLPFTALLDSQGRLAQRKLGETHYDELSAWAREIS